MAVYSMTGYASVIRNSAGGDDSTPTPGSALGNVNVELRSVNSRFLDLAFRLPDELRSLEPTLREALTGAFRRGKIEVRIAAERGRDAAWSPPPPDLLNALSRMENSVQSWLPKAQGLSVYEVLQLSRGAAPPADLDEVALAAAQEGVVALREARAREGARLVEMLLDRLGRLRDLARQAAPLVPQVVARQQERFLERWQEALQSAAAAAVPSDAARDRALSEAAAYALRIDVAEELSRLGAHLDEIERLLKGGGEIGKRLDFLIQELHREANTLGSKASVIDLTQISVEMRVLIEQMREQVQNIE
jgi:uncharacterized protein (TIGR00255 family)